MLHHHVLIPGVATHYCFVLNRDHLPASWLLIVKDFSQAFLLVILPLITQTPFLGQLRPCVSEPSLSLTQNPSGGDLDPFCW